MNSLPYAQATSPHVQPAEHCRVLGAPEHSCPQNVHDQNAPIFMNPLLPPQPVQTNWHNPPALPTASPSTPVPGHFLTSSQAFDQGERPSPSHHQRQLQSQEHSHELDNFNKEYDLEFPTLEAFHHWRSELEFQESVEFTKVGTEASPHDEYTKLACSRHVKSARDKYIGPFPGGFPSRKASPYQLPWIQLNKHTPIQNDGSNCPASITFRTYNGSQIVRAKYFSQHSHSIGQESLSFTRRGRKLADHNRRTQQHLAFSRANSVFPGSTPNIVTQVNNLSKDREAAVRNSGPDALRIEPPPMACLKPPESAAVCSNDAAEIGSCSSFVEDHSRPVPQNMPSELASRQAACLPPFACDVRDRVYDKKLACPNEPSYPSPGTSIHSRLASYSVLFASPSLDASVRQPQPNYMLQTHVPNYQSQYLPTPTTPSAQIHQPQPPNSYQGACSTAFSRQEPQGRAQTVPTTNSTHPSPISPVTPNTLPLTAPLNGQLHVLQHSSHAQNALPFSEDRWNHLETLFQAVRLRARSYVLPEPAICVLENLLRQLYAEGQQGCMAPDGDQDYENQATYPQ